MIKEGTSFLLFTHFPYNYSQDLPAHIGDGVYLDKFPTEALHNKGSLKEHELIALRNLIYPTYDLPGAGQVHCCLSCNSHPPEETGTLFYRVLAALRILKPIKLSIAGGFTYESQEEPIEKILFFGDKTIWQPEFDVRLNSDDFSIWSSIFEKLDTGKLYSYPRLGDAYTLFWQLTFGKIKSYQMAFVAIFAILEVLLVPKGNRGISISGRIETLLSPFLLIDDLINLIPMLYKNYRNNFAHGRLQDVNPIDKLTTEKLDLFGQLYELSRIILSIFLCYDEEERNRYLTGSGKSLDKALEEINLPRDLSLVEYVIKNSIFADKLKP